MLLYFVEETHWALKLVEQPCLFQSKSPGHGSPIRLVLLLLAWDGGLVPLYSPATIGVGEASLIFI